MLAPEGCDWAHVLFPVHLRGFLVFYWWIVHAILIESTRYEPNNQMDMKKDVVVAIGKVPSRTLSA